MTKSPAQGREGRFTWAGKERQCWDAVGGVGQGPGPREPGQKAAPFTLKETQRHLPTCEDDDRMQDQHLRSLQSHDGRCGLHRLPGTLTHFSNT